MIAAFLAWECLQRLVIQEDAGISSKNPDRTECDPAGCVGSQAGKSTA